MQPWASVRQIAPRDAERRQTDARHAGAAIRAAIPHVSGGSLPLELLIDDLPAALDRAAAVASLAGEMTASCGLAGAPAEAIAVLEDVLRTMSADLTPG